MKSKPDSREPWRIVKADGCFQIWTRFDDTPGSRNNYVIADGIQSEEDANRLCDGCSPLEPHADAKHIIRRAVDNAGGLPLDVQQLNAVCAVFTKAHAMIADAQFQLSRLTRTITRSIRSNMVCVGQKEQASAAILKAKGGQ